MEPQQSGNVTPVLLLILDGIGCRKEREDNAVALAAKPNWDRLWENHPHTLLHASESAVGLPDAQMGNSEVGHLNIGAGRIVYQELTRIDLSIRNGEFFANPVLTEAINTALEKGSALHILGLLSPGGVHSHESHIHAMLEMAARAGMAKIHLHAFLDGRDTPPQSAAASLAALEEKCTASGSGKIASIIGRYYAMDRDKRWERVHAAYDLMTQGIAEHHAKSAAEALEAAYARGETDEFVHATAIHPEGENPVRMEDGDVVVFMNYRADRAREITSCLTSSDFSGFERKHFPKVSFVMLTHYGDEFSIPAAFAPTRIENCFGEYLSNSGLRQLRIAETEKYAHVTYFFNGGKEEPYPGEDRIMVPSPKVATYDAQPEMSVFEVTEKLETAILEKKYQAIICNFANGDMVGHTGNLEATIRAVEAMDACIGRVVDAMCKTGGEVLISADHGNAEMMKDPVTHQMHTAHSLNLVPFLYIGKRPSRIRDNGALQDIAPTMLAILGLPQPPQMTGQTLVVFE
ncbi:MAG: 2,3-bisphosphoglycerate-independent phosphoglycerate mutase [Burkholderiales bacterium]|nr:2,3-bisphosphoglycerate-independent phosphoglycerate mutase [Burkholderiales bacterium]